MRLRTQLGVAAALAVGVGHVPTSNAVVRQKGADAPRVAAERGGRDHRTLTYIDHRNQLAAANLAGWSAAFDDDTMVPYRLWGSSPAIRDATADATVAEAAARAFLANHLDLLAPGAQLADLTLLANQLSPSGIRTVTFQQLAQGTTIAGAAINFAFKHDRLIMVGSTAVPHVASAISLPQRALAPATLAANAARWLAKSGRVVTPVADFAAKPTPRAIVPIIRPRLGAPRPDITYQVADEIEVTAPEGARAGHWKVWLDANTGAPIARESQLHYVTSTGTILFDVPDQSPSGTRSPHAAPLASFIVGSSLVTTDANGLLSWDAGDSAATSFSAVPKLAGTRVRIVNKSGALATANLALTPGGSTVWSMAQDPLADAQLDAFVYANRAKQFAKDKLNPDLAWVDKIMTVNVNENQTCNAFSEGDAVHFFIADTQCENTGRIADVVYHETGHSIHNQSVIPGAGAFEASLSEGLADTTAISITGDPGLGRGFFFDNQPLRNAAPATPKHWPEDTTSDEHDNGEIVEEALWDTRVALQTQLGTDAGYAHFLDIFYTIMQRSPDIPGAYLEALVADDDNGDLTDGTPNFCLIKTAFDRHGLADPAAALGITAPTRDGFTISLATHPIPAAASCGGADTKVTGATVQWRMRGQTGVPTSFDLSAPGASTTFAGAIPTQPDGAVVEYRVQVTLSNGDTLGYPNNPADPYYQFYVGTPTTLWCENFETGATDWTHSGTDDNWEVGKPLGLGGDPRAAFEGDNVGGNDLSTDGIYDDGSTMAVLSPSIDLQGHTQDVHLQYMRWLGVEDAAYDQATISANTDIVWENLKSGTDPQDAEVNHIDKEWRFQDVDVSKQAAAATDGKLQLRFGIKSDEGLGFSGWNIDTVCLVVAEPPPATCGDGQIEDGETCDDSNTASGDGCSSTCQDETAAGDGGCCSTGNSSAPTGALAMGALVIGGAIRRRRRR